VLTAAVATFADCSIPVAFHTLNALFYCLGPVTLFLLAWKLADSPWTGFIAALGYSLFSPAALLFPEIRADMGGLWRARRLHVLIYYGESPHIVALAFVPLAVLFLWLAVRRRGRLYAVMAGLLVSVTLLTNAFGGATVALAAASLLLSETSVSWRRRIAVVLAVCVLAFLWALPWMPPTLLASIRKNSPTAGGDFRPTVASVATAVLLPVALLGLHWLLSRRTRLDFPFRFSLLFLFLVAGVTLPAFYFNVNPVPQGKRYLPELEMTLWLAVPLAAHHFLRNRPTWLKGMLAAMLAAGATMQAAETRRFSRTLIRPHPNVARTVEFRTARWLGQNLHDRRVMVSGSTAFWYNVFTDDPQLSGGNDATALNWMQRVAVFIIYSGLNAGDRDGEIAVLWLKAFGVHAISVPGSDSEEYYKPFGNPRKFEGLLPVLWRDGDDTIYGVPQRSASLARMIPAGAVVQRTPAHGVDIAPLQPYVAAIEDPSLPAAEFTWRSRHAAVVRTNAAPDQLLSIQMNWHPGWRASVNGEQREIFADKLGLIVVRPRCNGPCEIELVYDGGVERTVAVWLRALAALGALAWLARGTGGGL
jgi:hypothetical protein